AGRVVGAHRKAHHVLILHDVLAGTLRTAGGRLLIGHWLAHADRATPRLQDQTHTIITADLIRAREGGRDAVRVGARCDNQVVFELVLVAVINQIHTGVNAGVLNARIGGNIHAPLGRIIPDQVVALARQRVQS